VCAIMGPSGAGKSSLLNVLAGRSAPAPGIAITGTVTVAGVPINPVVFRKHIAYVMQDDALMATQTPEDALRFSATLRLPDTMTPEEIDKLVQSSLVALGIDGCKDVMIGGPMIKGISGGQRKRTSIGIEIITNPRLLFLDEPTSGLDSHTAHSIVQILKTMAKRNTAVLLTIHQPSSEIFFQFDVVIFMKDGRIFYQGAPTVAVDYFAALGHKCPANYNPSDFVMSLSQTHSLEEMIAQGLMMKPPSTMAELAAMSPKSKSARQEGDEDSVSFNAVAATNGMPTLITASFLTQLKWLLHREFEGLIRNKAALGARFGVTIFLNTLFGLIFLGSGARNNSIAENYGTHFGCITMITISSMFGSAQPSMLEFPFERPMFMREYVTGTYSALAYFISKSCVELPLTLTQTIVQYILVYNMMDLQGFVVYEILAAWGLGLASASVAVALGCVIPDVKKVTEMAPLLFVPQILFAGFFIKMEQIPVFLRWVQYLCGLKYAMNIIIATEFAPELDACQGSAAVNCASALSSNNVEEDLMWFYGLMLAVLFLGFRTLGAIMLVARSKRFY